MFTRTLNIYFLLMNIYSGGGRDYKDFGLVYTNWNEIEVR